ncbi:DHH family phosphoesterase [Methanogenium marinum]|uniref:DHH family phosphoesterase n=1 Tax=Methanogenium marinum TaxID=348610 RepID=A0A9Q4KSX7_9EURY|nr:DHH family phosphoesterase [Methanogenium marinum]MDE4907598.1 DHH family phosphoesterase [Methanogenium marinum]
MTFEDDVRRVARQIQDADTVTVISHIDADGITSEAIMMQACADAGIPAQSVFVRQLEPMTMKYVPEDSSLKVFIDLGAGQQNLLEERSMGTEDVAIIDHHVAQNVDTPYLQANGQPYGYNQLSAAGIGYLVAKEMNPGHPHLGILAQNAVVGNVGDMMAREHCGLTGPAHEIAADGERAGTIRIVPQELNCYGISTRPLRICLSYSDDPFIPGISNNEQKAEAFLRKLEIEERTAGGRQRVWEDLNQNEKSAIINGLAQQMLATGQDISRLLAEHYIFPGEEKGTPLRNASEYATMLNACGRWAKPRVGSAVCAGDRAQAYREGEEMLRHHKRIIREMMEYILDTGTTALSHIQHIHVGDRFPDTIVGIGAGMALSKLDYEKPIMILCYLNDDPELTKVSMRTNTRMVERGVDLQAALITASEEIGGGGGGHKIAAGAYIPRNAEEGFAERVNRIIAEQRN